MRNKAPIFLSKSKINTIFVFCLKNYCNYFCACEHKYISFLCKLKICIFNFKICSITFRSRKFKNNNIVVINDRECVPKRSCQTPQIKPHSILLTRYCFHFYCCVDESTFVKLCSNTLRKTLTKTLQNMFFTIFVVTNHNYVITIRFRWTAPTIARKALSPNQRHIETDGKHDSERAKSQPEHPLAFQLVHCAVTIFTKENAQFDTQIKCWRDNLVWTLQLNTKQVTIRKNDK